MDEKHAAWQLDQVRAAFEQLNPTERARLRAKLAAMADAAVARSEGAEWLAVLMALPSRLGLAGVHAELSSAESDQHLVEVLSEVLVQLTGFYELCSDDVLDPDYAVNQLENVVSILDHCLRRTRREL